MVNSTLSDDIKKMDDEACMVVRNITSFRPNLSKKSNRRKNATNK